MSDESKQKPRPEPPPPPAPPPKRIVREDHPFRPSPDRVKIYEDRANRDKS